MSIEKPCSSGKSAMVSFMRYTLLTSSFLGITSPTTHVLALVSYCGAHDNVVLTQVSFTSLSETTQIITLAAVSSVCGRFHYGTTSPQWAIIDHIIKLT